ncbi:hypothetical protein J4Q44_G00266180 [Coregonus suidteri]|uniref:Myb-like domain-containing protein n=1 Tax=Coregonus suidteri TaxID=861788 RepID=A0AAN8L244_9TELE
MSNGELGFLLFLTLPVCHYAVVWSVYLEKQLDELLTKEKRSKVKKPKFEFPVYEPSLTVADSAYSPVYDQGTSIEDIEDQMDDWLEDKTSQKKKGTGEDITLLTRSRAKFPGGTPGRWEKIAHELGRSGDQSLGAQGPGQQRSPRKGLQSWGRSRT